MHFLLYSYSNKEHIPIDWKATVPSHFIPNIYPFVLVMQMNAINTCFLLVCAIYYLCKDSAKKSIVKKNNIIYNKGQSAIGAFSSGYRSPPQICAPY